MKAVLRDAVWSSAHLLGLPAVVRRRHRDDVLIVMYHAVVEDGAPFRRWTHVPRSRFEWQLRYLCRHYNVVPLARVVEAQRGGRPLPPHPAVLTFDDGYRSVHDRAFPLLRRLGLPATVFLTTGFVEGRAPLWTGRLFLRLRATLATELVVPGSELPTLPLRTMAERDAATDRLRVLLKALPDERRQALLAAIEAHLLVERWPDYAVEFEPLTWPMVEEMHASGLVEFGAHSETHPILSRMPESAMRREVQRSCRTVAERLGVPSVSFAYPNGQAQDFDERTKAALREVGVSCALSTIEGLCGVAEDLYALKRIGIGADMPRGRFAALCSGLASGSRRRLQNLRRLRKPRR